MFSSYLAWKALTSAQSCIILKLALDNATRGALRLCPGPKVIAGQQERFGGKHRNAKEPAYRQGVAGSLFQLHRMEGDCKPWEFKQAWE
jgi:hypothetical protein